MRRTPLRCAGWRPNLLNRRDRRRLLRSQSTPHWARIRADGAPFFCRPSDAVTACGRLARFNLLNRRNGRVHCAPFLYRRLDWPHSDGSTARAISTLTSHQPPYHRSPVTTRSTINTPVNNTTKMVGHNKKASPSNIQGQGKTPAIIKMARITKTFSPITTPARG